MTTFDQLAIVTEPGLAITSETKLPTARDIRAWWDQYQMLDNIRAHSEKVTLVALALTDWLVNAGVQLNRNAVEVGALAHDIAKTPCIKSGKLHAVEGEKILQQMGYPELGYLVRLHVYLPEDHPLDECMVVNYADKRVKHDEIVTLGDRWDYILERYSQGNPQRLDRLKWGRQKSFKMEALLFSHMEPGHEPADILRLDQEEA